MKTPVSDEAVAEYAARVRAGSPLGNLFPVKMSECDFTEDQRLVIRQARLDRKTTLRSEKISAQPRATVKASKPKIIGSAKNCGQVLKTKGFTKLRRLLFLQVGNCFFCGEPLQEAEASIEHLNPLSRGGQREEANEVVCHASLNEALGALELKRKFELILKHQGKFVCPKR